MKPTRYIDVVLNERTAPNFTKAFDIVREHGASTIAVGRYPGRVLDGRPVCYLRIGGRAVRKIASRLADAGYTVLSVHRSFDDPRDERHRHAQT
jgi:hypothetical protein